jgi:hypothetical protein
MRFLFCNGETSIQGREVAAQSLDRLSNMRDSENGSSVALPAYLSDERTTVGSGRLRGEAGMARKEKELDKGEGNA